MIKAFKNISVKKGYQYLVVKVMVFFIIAFIMDFIIGSMLNYLYFRQSSGWEYRTKYSIEDTEADILVFGASRAQQQYRPDFFEARLHQSCYNVGRDGEPFFYHYALLGAILKRHKPKLIILDIENGVFRKSQSNYDRIAVLLPFYKNHPEMRPIIELKSPFEKFKLQSRIYPYNSLLFKIAIGNTNLSNKRNEDIKGYLPLKRVLDEPARTVDYSKGYEVDNNLVSFYESFIIDCNKAGIKLYIICSPYYLHSIGEDASMVIAKEIARKNSIDFIDFSKNDFFLNTPRLFDDTVHVNVAGSEIFSNMVIDTLLLKSKNYATK